MIIIFIWTKNVFATMNGTVGIRNLSHVTRTILLWIGCVQLTSNAVLFYVNMVRGIRPTVHRFRSNLQFYWSDYYVDNSVGRGQFYSFYWSYVFYYTWIVFFILTFYIQPFHNSRFDFYYCSLIIDLFLFSFCKSCFSVSYRILGLTISITRHRHVNILLLVIFKNTFCVS